MIFGLIRILVLSTIAMAVLYVILVFYSRSVRTEKLEKEAREKVTAGALSEDAVDAFIQTGLEEFKASLRYKMILGVFAIPWVAIAVMTYVTNFM